MLKDHKVNATLRAIFILLASYSPDAFADRQANVSYKESVLIQLQQIIQNGDADHIQTRSTLPAFNSDVNQGGRLRSPFIIGGSPVERESFPEYALIVLTDGGGNIITFCGGTLIAPFKVLTAAHCSQGRASNYFVFPGFYSFSDGITPNNLIRVSSVANHPDYEDSNLDYDIAVMTLSSRVSTTPAKVAIGKNQLVEEMGFVIGVGVTATTPVRKNSDLLRGVDAPIVSNEDCSETFLKLDGYDPITANMVCAGSNNPTRGGCFGDSGGPLFVGNGNRKAIAGIVSFGFETCERQGAVTAYARTTSYTEFIRQHAPNTAFRLVDERSMSVIHSLLLDD
ncbi:MAG: serine protease [Acidiferrobacterales bacterium]|nr:serine protease [Acidiferrobacterales bacterium]